MGGTFDWRGDGALDDWNTRPEEASLLGWKYCFLAVYGFSDMGA